MNSITHRISFIACIALAWALVSGYMYNAEQQRVRSIEQGLVLRDAAEVFASLLEVDGSGNLLPPSERALSALAVAGEDIEWALFGDDGERLLGDGRKPAGAARILPYEVLQRGTGESADMGVYRVTLGVESQKTRVTFVGVIPANRSSFDLSLVVMVLIPVLLMASIAPFIVSPIVRATRVLGDSATSVDVSSLPTELHPLAERINTILKRQQRQLKQEREFAGNVAHELRTPLAVFQTGLQLLRRRLGEHQSDTVEELQETVAEMSVLVDNLLALSRSERARGENEVCLAPLVDEVWGRYDEQAKARALRFESRLGEEDLVRANADALRTILSNLISNAVAYTEEGGRVVVEGGPERVFSVWDSGPVPEPEQLERFFDRLWRADDARTDVNMHAGLGLPIARSLAEAMGLELVVEAAAEGGLRFTLR